MRGSSVTVTQKDGTKLDQTIIVTMTSPQSYRHFIIYNPDRYRNGFVGQ